MNLPFRTYEAICREIPIFILFSSAVLFTGPLTSVSAESKPKTDEQASSALAELIKEAEKNNPEIQAVLSKYEAARARPSQERSLPDPSIGFMATNMNNPVEKTGTPEI